MSSEEEVVTEKGGGEAQGASGVSNAEGDEGDKGASEEERDDPSVE